MNVESILLKLHRELIISSSATEVLEKWCSKNILLKKKLQ